MEDRKIIIAEWNKKKLMKSGSSRGVIIPKEYIKELGLENGVNIVVTKEEIIIKKMAV